MSRFRDMGLEDCWRDKNLRWSLFAACILSIAFGLREKIPRLKIETWGTLILITLADVGQRMACLSESGVLAESNGN